LLWKIHRYLYETLALQNQYGFASSIAAIIVYRLNV
jgi:hypothetical protein